MKFDLNISIDTDNKKASVTIWNQTHDYSIQTINNGLDSPSVQEVTTTTDVKTDSFTVLNWNIKEWLYVRQFKENGSTSRGKIKSDYAEQVKNRIRDMFSVIGNGSPTLIGFQEYPKEDKFCEEIKCSEYVLPEYKNWSYYSGESVFCKQCEGFDPVKVPYGHGAIITIGGKKVLFISAHFSVAGTLNKLLTDTDTIKGHQARQMNANKLREYIKKLGFDEANDPVIIVGDFNARREILYDNSDPDKAEHPEKTVIVMEDGSKIGIGMDWHANGYSLVNSSYDDNPSGFTETSKLAGKENIIYKGLKAFNGHAFDSDEEGAVKYPKESTPKYSMSDHPGMYCTFSF